MQERVLSLLIALPALVAGLAVHEFAHAWAATKLGDTLAKRQGRLTLDPMAHIDPLGAIFMLVSVLAGFFFGWAKPVPFDPQNFKHPRRDAMLVAIAGPISNLLQVPVWLGLLALLARLGSTSPEMYLLSLFGSLMGQGLDTSPMGILGALAFRGVLVNFTLAAFNMIPIPPLDGHYVLEFFGGEPVQRAFNAIRPYSFLILILLINMRGEFDVVSRVLQPVQLFAFKLAGLATVGQWLRL